MPTPWCQAPPCVPASGTAEPDSSQRRGLLSSPWADASTAEVAQGLLSHVNTFSYLLEVVKERKGKKHSRNLLCKAHTTVIKKKPCHKERNPKLAVDAFSFYSSLLVNRRLTQNGTYTRVWQSLSPPRPKQISHHW